MNHDIHSAFDSIHASESLKAHTMQAVQRKLQNCEGKPTIHIKRGFVAAVCCFFLVFVCCAGYLFYTTPVAAVSIDGSSSVELEINFLNRVISAARFTEEAPTPLEELSLEHLTYTQAVQSLLSEEEFSSSPTADSLLSITVVCKNEQKSQELGQIFSGYAQKSAGEVTCQSATKEEQQAAGEAGLSFGKYRAFLKLQSLDPTFTAEQAKQMSMRELKDRIDGYSSSSEEASSSEQEEKHPGQGNGNQYGRTAQSTDDLL